jgi:hypothetical protein
LDSMCGPVRAVQHKIRSTHKVYSLTPTRDVWVLTSTQAHVSRVRVGEYAGTRDVCVLTSTQAHMSRDMRARVISCGWASYLSPLFRHTQQGPRISARLHESPASSLAPSSPTLLTSHGGRSRGILTSTRNLRHARRALSACAVPTHSEHWHAQRHRTCGAEYFSYLYRCFTLVWVLYLAFRHVECKEHYKHSTSVQVQCSIRRACEYGTRLRTRLGTLPLLQAYEQSHGWMQRPNRSMYQWMLPLTCMVNPEPAE